MDSRKIKNYSLLLIAIFSGFILVGWTQTWFEISADFVAENKPISVSGQQLGGGVSGLALASFALVAALALVRSRLRQILGFVLFVLGVAVTSITISLWVAPVNSSLPILTKLTGVADAVAFEGLIDNVFVTPWPSIVAISGCFLALLGIIVVFTSARWPQGGKKYESPSSHSKISEQTSTSGKNIDDWDSLSRGEDPTIS